MRLTVFAAAAAAAAVITAALTTASSAGPESPTRGGAVTVTLSVSDVLRAQTAARTCQQAAELPVSRTAPRSSISRAGNAYRGWAVHAWEARLDFCEAVRDHTLTPTHDWATAVRVVQRAYPGSEWWLLSCSSGEGGHGEWVPNRGGSGAGGWMQYMEGTFWTDFNQAVADLRGRGFRVPHSAASWYSHLGQAVAAGWAYGHARWSGKWTGYGC